MLTIKKNTGKFCLLFAWILSLIATLITLYASEIMHLPVCHLCWYQRICIYPLVLLLGIALFREDEKIGIYTIPLVIMGGLFALYQYLLQLFPNFGPIQFCTMGADCRDRYFLFFHFLTYPLLNLILCVLLLILLTLSLLSAKNNSH